MLTRCEYPVKSLPRPNRSQASLFDACVAATGSPELRRLLGDVREVALAAGGDYFAHSAGLLWQLTPITIGDAEKDACRDLYSRQLVRGPERSFYDLVRLPQTHWLVGEIIVVDDGPAVQYSIDLARPIHTDAGLSPMLAG